MIEITIISVIVWMDIQGSLFDLENLTSPLALNHYLKNAVWVTVIILKGVFAMLPFLVASSELQDIIHDRIKLSY